MYSVMEPQKLLENTVPSGHTPVQRLRAGLVHRWRGLMDDIHPMVGPRWAFFAFVLFLYFLRVVLASGWYIITYGLGLYALNLFVAFLSPLDDPEMRTDPLDALSGEAAAEGGAEETVLPETSRDDFRPFIRRLPEFGFWYSLTRATLICILLTTTRLTDVPVFWPVLLLYFIALFLLTMQKRLLHMWKHRYLPFTYGKKKYAPKE